MRYNFFYKLLIILLLILEVHLVNAQTPSSGINFGVNTGITKLITEVSPGFSESYNEFDQKSGLAIDFELSKLLLKHFEIGISTGLSHLQGSLDDASLSLNKYKIQGDYFIRDLQGPLEYNNRIVSQKFFIGYYFRSFSNISETFTPEPFIRLGLGYISYGVELFDNNISTSGKGTENYADLSMSSAVFFATAGVKSYISSNLFLNVTFSCNLTNYDYLDAVFNFNEFDERLGYSGIYSEFKIGIFYQAGGKKKRNSARQGLEPNLPFSRQ